MKFLQFWIILIIHYLLVSCILQKEDENFVEVTKTANPQYAPSVTYSHSGSQYYPVKDTLWVSPGEVIYFGVEAQLFYEYELRTDGELMVSGKDNRYFELTADKLTPGKHQIEITAFAKSGTGSIADIMDAEIAAYKKSFILILGSFDFKPEIISIVNKDGTLRIEWTKYDRADFQAYEIHKSEPYADFQYGKKQVLIIKDQNQTIVNDSTYVGGTQSYSLKVNRGGSYFYSEAVVVDYRVKHNMLLINTGQGKARLEWAKSPFYNNISSYEIYKTTNGNGTTAIAQNIPPSQNFIEFSCDAIFGEVYGYSLVTHSKHDGEGHHKLYHYQDLTFGKRTPPISDIEYDPHNDQYYIGYYTSYNSEYINGIYRLDSDLNVIDSVQISNSFYYPNLISSPDGNHWYAIHDYFISKIDKNPIKVSTTYYPANLSVRESSNKQNYSVSNNNLLVYSNYDYFYIYDINNKKLILNAGSAKSAHISANGKYFLIGSKLHFHNGSAFVLSGSLPYSSIEYVRFIDDTNEVLIATDNKVIIYDYIKKEEIKQYLFSTPAYSNPYFDQASQRYIVNNSGLVTLNITDGTRQVYPVAAGYGSRVIAGKYHFHTTGFGLEF